MEVKLKKYNVHISINNGLGFRGFLVIENISLEQALKEVSLSKELDCFKNEIRNAKAVNFAITETEDV